MTGIVALRGRRRVDRASRTLLVLSAVVALAVSLTPPADSASADVGVPAAEGRAQVFVTFADAPGAAGAALVRRAGGEIRYAYELVPTIAASVPQAAVAGLQAAPGVVVVEPIGTVSAVDVDPEKLATELDDTWGVKRIGTGEAHGVGHVADGVRVAVLDSGQAEHRDLVLDADCSWHPEEFDSIADGNGHGTHVAGTVGALRDGVGVVGTAPAVQLCAMKVLGDDGNGDYADVIAALEHIVTFNDDVANGTRPGPPIRITNNSYGSVEDPGLATQAAFDQAARGGVLHIGAAGNNGQLPARFVTCIYPALYDSVVAVAATTKDDKRANFSSRCDAVELAAPGVDINSTAHTSTDAYRLASGTSMASPHVAGSAALVMAACPGWGAAEVRKLLVDTALPLGAQTSFGSGLVQPLAATEDCAAGQDDGLEPEPAPDPTPGPDPDPAIELTASGYTVRGLQKADLGWTGATSTAVDVSRNGKNIATVSNSGKWTDEINLRGGGSYTYRVCEAGSSTCSGDVTVTF